MILVSVRTETEASLATALSDALEDSFEFFILFASQELERAHAAKFRRSSSDAGLCALNPHNFKLLIVFSGANTSADVPNLQWIEFFHELGISTLEVQHRFLQHDEAHPLEVAHASKSFLRWEGDGGIGYLKSEIAPSPSPAWRENFVLVLSSDRMSEQDRYRFAIAVLKLAADTPDLPFVWNLHPQERASAVARPAFAMLEEYHLANLSIERGAEAETLIPSCLFGISCPSTALLDFHRYQKPVLIYRGSNSVALPARVRAASFHSASELAQGFLQMRSAPAEHLLSLEMGRLDRERLKDAVAAASQTSTLRTDWQSTAVRFASRGAFHPSVVEEPDIEVERLSKELSRLSERITVLQRSTLAYKAKKLATRFRKSER